MSMQHACGSQSCIDCINHEWSSCLPGLGLSFSSFQKMLLACFLHILFSPLCLAFMIHHDKGSRGWPMLYVHLQSSLHAIRVAIKFACSEVCMHPESELQASFSVLLWPLLCLSSLLCLLSGLASILIACLLSGLASILIACLLSGLACCRPSSPGVALASCGLEMFHLGMKPQTSGNWVEEVCLF